MSIPKVNSLTLELLPHPYAVCRLPADAPFPAATQGAQGTLFSVTRTADEMSLVCIEDETPEAATCERGWRCLRVMGTLDFSLVGVLANLTDSLARALISVFVISTFDTDYLLVTATNLDAAVKAIEKSGHSIRR